MLVEQLKYQPLLKYFLNEEVQLITHKNQSKPIDPEIREALITLTKKFKDIRLKPAM
jgi:hypothetical protein